MLVYGDQVRTADPRAELHSIAAELTAVAALPPGIVRHGRLVGAMINAGMLTQGLADHETALRGRDVNGPLERSAMALTLAIAQAVLAAWENNFVAPIPAVRTPTLNGLPDHVELRQPEGYAFYAVYPEAYGRAARLLPPGPASVIGLRSIGTSLAAVAAAARGASSPASIRPTGDPFARTLALSPALAARLGARPDHLHIIVDEGPGLSGSSFGAAADWLEQAGIAPARIAFLPSHNGWPGPNAAAANLRRWSTVQRPVIGFDALILHAKPGLADWFSDLVGSPTSSLRDLSGGAWRAERGLNVPADPFRERRKYQLHTQAGVFVLKFVGLGGIGAAKFARAKLLAGAGLIPEPIALRHGFLIERWHTDASTPTRLDDQLVTSIGAYIGHRAALPPPATRGATLPALAAMARHNTAEAHGQAASSALHFHQHLSSRPAAIDGRLHTWEWLSLPDGRLLKADALDHDAAHDLIGPQDLAWDIAGATVEFGLDGSAAEHLRRVAEHHARRLIDPRLVADHIVHYSAFQLGLWTGVEGAQAQRAIYSKRLIAPRN